MASEAYILQWSSDSGDEDHVWLIAVETPEQLRELEALADRIPEDLGAYLGVAGPEDFESAMSDLREQWPEEDDDDA